MKGEPLEVRFWRKVDKSPGQGPDGDCWFWIGALVRGYGQIIRDGTVEYAHRVSYEMHNGVLLPKVREGGPLVCHTCDMRACVRPKHLFVGSNSDNMQDMIRKGRQVIRDNKGEANPQAKLTESDVRAIRADTRSLSAIADDYAICRATVHYVKERRLWPHIP